MIASAGAIALAACSSQPMYGSCVDPRLVMLSSPCGFASLTSTCTGANIDRSSDDTRATIQPIQSSCTITAKLGDGTTHQVDVTVGPIQSGFCKDVIGVTSDNGADFTSATCQRQLGDAATD
jgi:hypothetical protein